MLRVGQFKAPFSYSALGSTAETPFVRRPRVVGALRLGRPVGAALEYRLGSVVLRGGVFNGATCDGEDEGEPVDKTLLLYVGRAAWETSGRGGRTSVGINVAYDASAGARGAAFRYGTDVHVERTGAFVTAEALARAEPQPSLVTSGAYLTAGYAVREPHLVRARLDHVSAERASDAVPAPTLLGLGYTFRPDGPLRIEVDYLVPLTSPGLRHSSVLVNLQVGL